ncbi:hypothetical protein [Peribacillus frigoritolerans]|uniref:Uncharacterized protein n=1 Tax=Peribacillus castrilensis TaxID=2897690 RepID=A0AAW9N5U6_9BACI|nr:hypothetical protein [Peribacillus castrilensis]
MATILMILSEYDGTTKYVNEDVITVYGDMTGEQNIDHKPNEIYQSLVCSFI